MFHDVQTLLNNCVESFFFIVICQLHMYQYCCLLTVLMHLWATCKRLQ